ncbi:MAG TPA: alpha/beta fold hydrolase [Burkholderiaceae bacterium]|nr:alpha/beta fold hydrolase [Burkholderiaceae bacterium]
MVLVVLVCAVLLVYAALLTVLWLRQERLLFAPEVLAADAVLSRAPDVHESTVEVPGARLSVLELRLPAPKGVVFYLHGNAGSLRTWSDAMDFYRQANFDVLMMDYRGYGKSTGRIESEAQLHADARAVWERFAPRYRDRRVVFFGRSLGTGPAAALAAQLRPDLTVLVAPYLSMAALAAQHYRWVPTRLLRYPMRTDQVISQIEGPVLLLHGEADALIPASHSQALQSLASQGRAVIVPGAGHGDVHEHPVYLRELRGTLDAL